MTTNQTIPLNRIKPHPDNYNTHPDRQIETLRESLRQFGQVRSVVVQAPAQDNGFYLCVAGHGLTQAAEEEGFVEVRADVLPADWPPHKVKAYLVADNETQKGSDPDLAQLDALIKEIGDIDAELLKAMAVDVDALLAAMDRQPTDPANDPYAEWEGMPEFEQEKIIDNKLTIYFISDEDKQSFARLVGQDVNENTKFLWFPKEAKPMRQSKQLMLVKNES